MTDINLIKDSLTINDIDKILTMFGATTKINYGTGSICSSTICHNQRGMGKDKLYYYDNKKLFHCYTECSPSNFDIFTLVIKVFKIQRDEDIKLPQAIEFVVNAVGLKINSFQGFAPKKDDLVDLLEEVMAPNDSAQDFQLNECGGDALIESLPTVRIPQWEEERITVETMLKYKIRFYAPAVSIVIPHYDINDRLIGIRNRLLKEEDIEKYGKYCPLLASGVMYNHPLGYALYGLNFNKENIKKMKIAIIFEGEKSVLILDSILENNISCAACGSSISDYQIKQLMDLGVQEICIAFDKQYKELFDDEYIRWTNKLNNLILRYRKFFTVTAILDTENLLDYKDSPVDKGGEVFFKLFEKRITSNE